MREKTIEQKLAAAVKKHGGLSPKFVSPGFDGMPDRIVLFPMAGLPLWKSKHREKYPVPCSLQGTGCFEG